MNSLKDLNDYMFELMDRLTDNSLDDAQLQKESDRSNAVIKVAGAIVDNGRLALDSMKHMAEWGLANEANTSKVVKMLGVGDDAKTSGRG